MRAVVATFFVCAVLVLVWIIVPAAKRRRMDWAPVWALLSTWIFLLSAFRVGGSDWENYDSLYRSIAGAGSLVQSVQENFLFEPLYVALNRLFTLFSPERRALVVWESAVNAFAIYLVLTRIKGGPVLMIWLFPLQFANILGVRQTLATSLVLVALLALQASARRLLLLTAPFLHLSAIVFYVGHRLRGARMLTRQSAWLFVGVVLAAGVSWTFLAEKFDNYLQNAGGITDLSSTQVVVGKLLSLAFLLSLTGVAAAVKGPRSIRISPALSLCAVVATAGGLISPSLVRLATPLEFFVAWQCADGLVRVREWRSRFILVGVLVGVGALKMMKIVAQFDDIYSVCFFCA